MYTEIKIRVKNTYSKKSILDFLKFTERGPVLLSYPS